MEIIAAYTYDYKLRRIIRLSKGMRWYIFYDQQDRMINETNELGYSMDYIYLGIEPIAKIEYNWAIDHLYFYHNDHLMTPLKMTSDSSQIVWQAEYYPFGKLYSENGPVSNNIRFPGQYDDKIPSTSLYYNWNRFYNPSIGRYQQSIIYDTIFGYNLDVYFYADSNSIIFIDSKGRCPGTTNPKKCCEADIQKEIKKCDDKYKCLSSQVDWWPGIFEYARHWLSSMGKCKKNPSWQTCGYNSCGEASAMFKVLMQGCAGPCCELEVYDMGPAEEIIWRLSGIIRRIKDPVPFHTVIDLMCKNELWRRYDPFWEPFWKRTFKMIKDIFPII